MLKSVNLEFLDWELQLKPDPEFPNTTLPTPKVRNIDVRLRLTEPLHLYPNKLAMMYQEFFHFFATAPDLNSDTLMALTQLMFEIESYKKEHEMVKLIGVDLAKMAETAFMVNTGHMETQKELFEQFMQSPLLADVINDPAYKSLMTVANEKKKDLHKKPPKVTTVVTSQKAASELQVGDLIAIAGKPPMVLVVAGDHIEVQPATAFDVSPKAIKTDKPTKAIK